MRKVLLFLFPFLLLACATNDKVSTQLDPQSAAYLAFPDYGTVTLSKRGRYISVVSIIKNQRVISIHDRKTMKTTAVVPLEKNMNVVSFIWIDDENLIVQAMYSEGYLKGVPSEQFLFSMKYNGEDRKQLFPRKSVGNTASNSEFSFVSLVSDEIIKDRFLLVAETKLHARKAQRVLSLLNIYNGSLQDYDLVPMENGDYAIDNEHKARLAYRLDKMGNITVLTKNLDSGTWSKKDFWKDKTRAIDFLGFSKDNKTFYFLADNKKTMNALYSAQISKQGNVTNIKEMFSYPEGDILTGRWDKEEKLPLFVEYGDGRPQRKYFSKGKKSQLLQNLDKAFPGERVYMSDPKGEESLIVVYSDQRPPTYYLFNHKTKSVDEFLSSNEKVRTFAKVSSQLISYKTRDGQTIRGYLHQPKGIKTAPLIMYVHGGPFGVFDRWGYDGDIQYMVSKGFAVLQVNYRGSGGRGRAFEELGYKKLGTHMQEDLVDAAQWAIKNKYTQKGKICLWGISYGGYASMMSIHKYPDVFECAVGFGGAYNWTNIVEQGDGSRNEYAKNFWAKSLPDTYEEKYAQSPVSLAAKLQKEVYIMHGEDDVRCSVLQARELRTELDKHQKKYRYKEFPHIGHWFVADQEQKNWAYNEIMEFIGSKIKN